MTMSEACMDSMQTFWMTRECVCHHFPKKPNDIWYKQYETPRGFCESTMDLSVRARLFALLLHMDVVSHRF